MGESSKSIPRPLYSGEIIDPFADVEGHDAGKIQLEERKKAKDAYKKIMKAKKDKEQVDLEKLKADQLKLNTFEKVALSTKVEQLDSDERLTLSLPSSRTKNDHGLPFSDIEVLKEEIEKKTSCRTNDAGRKLSEKEVDNNIILLKHITNHVGAFAGPYDHPLGVPLKLGSSEKTFDDYTEFSHEPKDLHYIYEVDLVELEHLNEHKNMNEIQALYPVESSDGHIKGPSQLIETENEPLTIFYTCTDKQCKIPCVCKLCNFVDPPICDEHEEVNGVTSGFDITKEAFTVKFDAKPLKITLTKGKDDVEIIKFSGIPNDCEDCEDQLKEHESYHFVIHNDCKFCNFIDMRADPFSHHSNEELKLKKEDENDLDQHVCHICIKGFHSIHERRRHVKEVHSSTPIPCEYCEFETDYIRNLRSHIDEKHLECPRVKCSDCNFDTVFERNLRQHVKKVHRQNELHKCPKCDYATVFKRNMKSHNEHVHENKNKLTCNICPFETIYERSLTRHKDKFHVHKIKKCELCDYEDESKVNLKRHIKEVHTDKTIHACDECDFTDPEKRRVTQHKKTVHKLKKCELCDYEDESRVNLNRHIKEVHTEETIHACDECDFTDPDKRKVTQHKKTVHKLNKCELCDYEDESKVNLC